MAASDLVTIPEFTASIPQEFIIEALGGPQHPEGALDVFPTELYHKSPDSHLLRFMYVLLGPLGVGRIKKNFLDARIALEELGLELFDLDSFFGNPFAFGRILEEYYDEDTTGLIDNEARERIRARDSGYRNRALDFLGGVRLGNTPEGMRLVARGGLGHNVEIVENYKYFYDLHSDLPVGFRYYGRTALMEEMVIVPRAEISRSEVQTITVSGNPTGGSLSIAFNGRVCADTLAYNAPALSNYDISIPATPVLIPPMGLQEILEAHPDLGVGTVRVSGGVVPDNPWIVTFIGTRGHQDVPEITITLNSLTGGISPSADVDTVVGGLDSSIEVANLPPRDVYHLQQAIDRIKAITTVPTVADGSGLRSPQPWGSIFAGSSFTEVLRYVTGSAAVVWPAVDALHWIRRGVENEAPRATKSEKQHYQCFHDVSVIRSYTDGALLDVDYEDDVASVINYPVTQIGPFGPAQRALYPTLDAITDETLRFTPDRALADYPNQPVATGIDPSGGTSLIQGIYPVEYADLPGVPPIRYRDEQFWASHERLDGTDYLEIDFGSVQVVNFVAFETLRKPIDISIDFDLLDQSPRRSFIPVTEIGFPNRVSYSAAAGWTYLEFDFSDLRGEPIYTRFLRIGLGRRATTPAFLVVDGVEHPWSTEVRNLRLGRNVN